MPPTPRPSWCWAPPQYDGTPSPVFQARLDHALDLYEQGLAPTIVVTGGNQPGDRFTEAAAGANYLLTNGCARGDIRREVDAHNSWESLAAVARILDDEGIEEVILVSDPYHSYRVGQIAGELGMTPHLSPTRSSPASGSARCARWCARRSPCPSGASSATDGWSASTTRSAASVAASARTDPSPSPNALTLLSRRRSGFGITAGSR